MKKLFGTDGIRGTANQFPITAELALKLGRSLPSALNQPQPRILIGRDTRLSGDMLQAALTAGLLAEGTQVLHAGILPTPAIARLTIEENCHAGIMLTASHNPFPDNGIKIFGPDGYKLNDQQETTLEQLLLTDTPPTENSPVGTLITLTNPAQRFLDFLKSSTPDLDLTATTIVLDAAHGAGYQVGPALFEQLGATVIPLGTQPTGTNINHQVGSLHPEQAATLVQEHQAHLGVCLDGDADRLTLIDATGTIVNGDRLLCLAALALKRRGQLANDTLVATIMSNLGLSEALAKHNLQLETTAVGDRHVLERMREKGHTLGGENSGHLIFSQHATTGDGILAALQILAEMKATGQPLATLANCMEVFPQTLINIPVRDKPPLDQIPGLPELISQAESEMATNGRVLVRYSGTEKKMRVMVEAKEDATAQHWAQTLSDLVQKELGV